MNTDLIVIIAAGPQGRLEIVGHYETELDDQPGLEHVMARAKQYPERSFYALRIDPDRAATLQEIEAAPHFGPLLGFVASHPTDDRKRKHLPPGHAKRHARHRANQCRMGMSTAPCWGCNNGSDDPEQHVCGEGNRED